MSFLLQLLSFISPVLLLSKDRHLAFIYGKKKIEKIKESKEAIKALKGHFSFLIFFFF